MKEKQKEKPGPKKLKDHPVPSVFQREASEANSQQGSTDLAALVLAHVAVLVITVVKGLGRRMSCLADVMEVPHGGSNI